MTNNEDLLFIMQSSRAFRLVNSRISLVAHFNTTVKINLLLFLKKLKVILNNALLIVVYISGVENFSCLQ